MYSEVHNVFLLGNMSGNSNKKIVYLQKQQRVTTGSCNACLFS